MDGLHTLSASTHRVTVGGREIYLAPLRLVDYATIERHLLDQRPDPLAAVLARLPEFDGPQLRHLLELAYDDLRRGPRIAHAELFEWIDTHEGQIYRLWLSWRREDPSATLADVEQALQGATPAEEAALREALEQLAGDPRGN